MSASFPDAFGRACRLFATDAAFARAIGATPQFVGQIKRGEKGIPADLAVRIEQATRAAVRNLPRDPEAGVVTRAQLRPD